MSFVLCAASHSSMELQVTSVVLAVMESCDNHHPFPTKVGGPLSFFTLIVLSLSPPFVIEELAI